MVEKLSVGDQSRETHIRFRNFNVYGSFINSVDEEYDAADSIFFNGYVFEVDTPQFNLIRRSEYGNDCDFKKEFIEYRGNNCFIPTKGYCFIKCVHFKTGKDYKKQFLEFIQREKKTIIYYD